MDDRIKRTETTHIDEVRRTSTSTTQLLLERDHMAGTHPISHNNKLTYLIGGEEAFADIAASIANAKESIDICCWGFDPGMELVRPSGGHWPRGPTYGDLLIAAGARGVKVRLLVWYDAVAVQFNNPRNMPGHTHGIDTVYLNRLASLRHADARKCLAETEQDLKDRVALYQAQNRLDKEGVSKEIASIARARYCMNWYEAAFNGLLKNIEIRKRTGDADAISKSLSNETHQPSHGARFGAERQGMVHFGTHHQKPILIDFFHDEGNAAIAYIMGLNSLTEYWDTAGHFLDDSRREYEAAAGVAATAGCQHLKPFRDYAFRIDGGRALVPIYNNFIKAWDRAASKRPDSSATVKAPRPRMPEACLRKARPGDSTVQIVRTQPEESDKSIRDLYFQATDQAALATGYIYLENQYFQYAEWAQRLLQKRKAVMEKWNASCASCGKTVRDMPILHVFIVIPVPEQAFMIPRTYETLATLGQQEGMTGQSSMIKERNQMLRTSPEHLPDVVQDANKIQKPSEKMLETTYGLKVCTAMLNACDFSRGKWRYREIYIHSKLLLIDDTFLTIGSANLNQRSMAVDSEINLGAIAPDKVSALRREIWAKLSGQQVTVDSCDKESITKAFATWRELVKSNNVNKKAGKRISGFLVSLEDKRSSTTCLG